MHDVLSVAITVATILGATFFSNAQLNSLRTELNALRAEFKADQNSLRSELLGKIDAVQRDLNGKMDSLQRDMREFYAEQRLHDTRITALERASSQR